MAKLIIPITSPWYPEFISRIYMYNQQKPWDIIGIVNGFTLWLSNIAMEAMAHENGWSMIIYRTRFNGDLP
jgi:hypothetical protein